MAFMPGVLATFVKVGALALGEVRSPSRTAWHCAQTLCAKRCPSLVFPLSSANAEVANVPANNTRKVFSTADFIGSSPSFQKAQFSRGWLPAASPDRQ